jgi:hypothetical protein
MGTFSDGGVGGKSMDPHQQKNAGTPLRQETSDGMYSEALCASLH